MVDNEYMYFGKEEKRLLIKVCNNGYMPSVKANIKITMFCKSTSILATNATARNRYCIYMDKSRPSVRRLLQQELRRADVY